MRELSNHVVSQTVGRQILIDVRNYGFTPKPHHHLVDNPFYSPEANAWILFELSGARQDGLFRTFVVKRDKNQKFHFTVVMCEVRFLTGTHVVFVD